MFPEMFKQLISFHSLTDNGFLVLLGKATILCCLDRIDPAVRGAGMD